MPLQKQLRYPPQLPGPKGLPLIGNFLQIKLPRLHLILEKWADSYGNIYQFKLFNKTVVVISDIDLIQNILRKRPETFRRISSIERVARELGTHGVFSAEGTQWQRQRPLVMQAFRTENLRRFFPELRTIAGRLQDRWRQMAEIGQDIEVRKEWMKFTVDVTTQFAFGYDINLLEKESDDFQRHLEKQLPAFNRRANAPFPYWHYVKLPSDLAMEKSLAAIKKTIHGFMQETRKRLEQKTGSVQPSNFLEALLLAQTDEGAPLPDEEIQGNVLTILMAGEDTTAHTLSWMLYLISEHPEVQIRMQQEADAVLGEERLVPDFASIDKLTYIEAVAHETLRLKSVAPMLFLEPTVDVELDGKTIPKGATLMLLTRHSALQEKNFTDALQFKPERWFGPTPTGHAHNRSAIMPFGGGSRFCPGRQLAMLEIKLAMAMVCRNFSVSRVETGQPVREVFSFTMMPSPFFVTLKTR